jgi:hypothetical protein
MWAGCYCEFMKDLIQVILLTMALYAVGSAKPMPSPTLDDGVTRSKTIVVVKYQGYRASGKIDYFGGPVAEYKVVRTLKGTAPGTLSVRYDFQDGSACLAESDWKFSPSMMPKVGSQWILLLTTDTEPAVTYRGDFGRIPYTTENLTKIKAEL